jgi:hypothetical protein
LPGLSLEEKGREAITMERNKLLGLIRELEASALAAV